MSTSVTEQADQEIPLGLPRADALETSANVPASPTSCPLEGRALTFSSPVPVVAAAVSLEESNVVGITHGDVHSLDRLASITMNDMLQEEDRHDDMLKKAAHEQAGGKIGQHDAKIQSFQERIDQAEEQIHDLEVIMVDRQEDGKALTTRRAAAITAQLVAKRKRIQGWHVSISSVEERKKQCLSKDQQRLDDEASRENARWDDCVIIDLIKLRWDSNRHFRGRFDNKVERNEQVMAELSAALNAIFPNLNKSAAAVTNKIREVKAIFTLYSDAKQRAMQSGCPSDEVLVCVLLNIPFLLDVKTAASSTLSVVSKVMHMCVFC
jgi:hypothetical protein